MFALVTSATLELTFMAVNVVRPGQFMVTKAGHIMVSLP